MVKVKRPSHYFDPDNTAWPDLVELRLEMPTEFDYGIELAQQRIAARVKERAHRAWQESKRTGIAFAAWSTGTRAEYGRARADAESKDPTDVARSERRAR